MPHHLIIQGEFIMRRLSTALAFLFTALLLTPVALAGSAHFIDSAFTASRDDTTLTVTGKVAGLGGEPQIHVVLTATASCVNPGGNHPKAGNKQALTAEGDFPVQNGKADFSLSATATFQPECSPPMVVEFSDVTVVANSLSFVFPGVY